MKMSDQNDKISAALIKAQKKMGSATKDAANPYFKSKYADYGAVLEVCKEPLNEVGIIILQPTFSNQLGHFVETILLHESGQFISSGELKLELSKTDMQQLGSAITYARRYTLQSLLSIPSEDDDGESTMVRTKTTTEAKPTSTKKPSFGFGKNKTASATSAPALAVAPDTQTNGATDDSLFS